MLMRLYENF